MHVKRSIVESSTNLFFHGNATVRSVFIAVVVDINNVNVFFVRNANMGFLCTDVVLKILRTAENSNK